VALLVKTDSRWHHTHRPIMRCRKMSISTDGPHPLYWESSYEIVLRLMERYPDADLDSLGLHDLYTMIVTLPDFADDPALAHDGLLIEIMREYYEEATTHDQR
jgi:FeS assembly protein IscX